ncbi:MAG: DUF4960 domain-containing protein, partial [Prevotella sp.]|nr:DUF4960 domain-containing protein [Prevotella sp.]
MKAIYKFLFASLVCCGIVALVSSCQDKDYERSSMILNAPDVSQITGTLTGDNYTWTWPTQAEKMQVIVYRNGALSSSEIVSGNTFTHTNVPTNVPFEYVFKLTDGTNFSQGVVKKYTREGATSISGVQMSQVDKTGGYDALVVWNPAVDASSIKFVATNGKRTISETLNGSATSYTIQDVVSGDTWEVTLTAVNEKGTSLSTKSSLRIGKTAIGFLSIYPTPEELVQNGDDDEASAWLWLHENYPTAQYLYFGNIKAASDVEPFRVLFWLRDLEGVGEDAVWNIPEVVQNATPVIKEWYKEGGSLLLWSHATTYVGHLGRLNLDDMKNNDHAIGTGVGGINMRCNMMLGRHQDNINFWQQTASQFIETVYKDMMKNIYAGALYKTGREAEAGELFAEMDDYESLMTIYYKKRSYLAISQQYKQNPNAKVLPFLLQDFVNNAQEAVDNNSGGYYGGKLFVRDINQQESWQMQQFCELVVREGKTESPAMWKAAKAWLEYLSGKKQ